MLQAAGGVLLLVYSAILSRGVVNLRAPPCDLGPPARPGPSEGDMGDMDHAARVGGDNLSKNDALLCPGNGHCRHELVNLLLRGRGIPACHDSDNIVACQMLGARHSLSLFVCLSRLALVS